ncbi:hypothetical protein QQ045_004318 [Rhodiola kirilowii]
MMKKEEEATAMDNSNYGSRRSSNGTLFYSDVPGGGGAVGGYGNYESSTFSEVGGELGFMEMLGMHQEFQIPMGGYMLDEMFQKEVLLLPSRADDHHQVAAAGDGNKAPETPNSSSISSASNNEGVVAESEQEKVEDGEDEDEDEDGDDEEEEQDHEGSGNCRKQLKAKKANLKKQKQPRFAFMTKSEVDHLEDGYRWRKYGQKAVKNSPFPRSYYRCTSTSCGVKKRVERSSTDPSIVVTTYEGQHTHPSPLTPRGLSSAIFADSAAFAATMPTLMQMNNLHSRYQHQHLPAYFASPLNYNTCLYPTNNFITTISPAIPNFTSFTPSATTSANLVSNPNRDFMRDHGLLQDLIPSVLVPKEE